MPLFEIRVARPSDGDVLRDLYRRSSLSNAGDRKALLANPDALLFDVTSLHEQRTRVAIVSERIVGFATTLTVADHLELDDLFVDPDWMRQGVARALVIDAAATARSCGQARVEVTANSHALDFYKAVGFVIDGVTDTQFGSGLRMHLDVPS